MEGTCENCLSVMLKWTNQICYCTLAARHHRGVYGTLAKVSMKLSGPVLSMGEKSSALFFLLFIVKMSSSCDKTAAVASSALMSLAAAVVYRPQ